MSGTLLYPHPETMMSIDRISDCGADLSLGSGEHVGFCESDDKKSDR